MEAALVSLKENYQYNIRSKVADSIAIKVKSNQIGDAYKLLDEVSTMDGKQPFNDIMKDMQNISLNAMKRRREFLKQEDCLYLELKDTKVVE